MLCFKEPRDVFHIILNGEIMDDNTLNAIRYILFIIFLAIALFLKPEGITELLTLIAGVILPTSHVLSKI